MQGTKIFTIDQYDRGLGLTLQSTSARNITLQPTPAPTIITVTMCKDNSQCPGTLGNELTHVNGTCVVHFTLSACVDIIIKSKAERIPFVLIFQDWDAPGSQQQHDDMMCEISDLLSEICDLAVRDGLIQRFLQGQPITQPPKRPTERWMPELKLKLGKRHRQLIDLQRASSSLSSTSNAYSSTSFVHPPIPLCLPLPQNQSLTLTSSSLILSTSSSSTPSDILVASFPVTHPAAASLSSTMDNTYPHSHHHPTMWLTDLADRVDNHQQSFASTSQFATKHIGRETARHDQLCSSMERVKKDMDALSKEQKNRTERHLKTAEQHATALRQCKATEKKARQEYLRLKSLREQAEQACSDEKKSMKKFRNQTVKREKMKQKDLNKKMELLRRCIANLERMEGVKYWSETLRDMANGAAGEWVEGNASKVLDVVLRHCVNCIERAASSGMSITERDIQERGMVHSLSMLIQCWFAPTEHNPLGSSDLLQRIQREPWVLKHMPMLSMSPSCSSSSSSSSFSSSSSSSTTSTSASSSTSAFFSSPALPRTIVLYHSGTHDHVVDRGHPEQNARVVKCAAMLRSHSAITIDECKQLQMPSTVVLRLVHSGDYLERIVKSTIIAKENKNERAPMIHSDREIDDNDDDQHENDGDNLMLENSDFHDGDSDSDSGERGGRRPSSRSNNSASYDSLIYKPSTRHPGKFRRIKRDGGESAVLER